MSNSDEIPSVCVNPEVFQMPVMFKKMLMWRERCLLLVEDGYYIGNLKNDAFCDSDDKKFYELKNAKIIIEKGEFSITIVHNDDSLVQLKCKSDSDKMALINKMNEVIYKISEKNAFSDDYINNEKEIQKLDSIFGDKFDGIMTTLKRFQNLFSEISTKTNYLLKIVDVTRFKIKSEKEALLNTSTSLFCIKEEMKKQFEILIRKVFEYREDIIKLKKEYNIIDENDYNKRNQNTPKNNNDFQEEPCSMFYSVISDGDNFGRGSLYIKKVEKEEYNQNDTNTSNEKNDIHRNGKKNNIQEDTIEKKNAITDNPKQKEFEKEISPKNIPSDDDEFNDCDEIEQLPNNQLSTSIIIDLDDTNDKKICFDRQLGNSFFLKEKPDNLAGSLVQKKISSTKNSSNPILNFEPLSLLQRTCEIFCYDTLLTTAANENNKTLRLCYIGAFFISSLSLSINRFMKPFPPILGETFEFLLPQNNFRFIAEQVNYQPPISAFHGENDFWAFFGDNRCKDNFKILKGANKTEFESKYHLKIKNCNDYYVINKPNLLSKGVVLGETRFDFEGTVDIINSNDPSVKGEITFIEENSKNRLGSFEGKIIENGVVKYLLKGNWTSYVYYCDPDGGNHVTIWKIVEESYLNNNEKDEYHLPSFSVRLSHIDDKIKTYLPPSDSRLRPDIREREQGNNDKANEIKTKLEKKEIEKMEELAKNNILYQPNYFYEVFDQNSFDNVYIYKGGYWEDRKSESYDGIDEDIFEYK